MGTDPLKKSKDVHPSRLIEAADALLTGRPRCKPNPIGGPYHNPDFTLEEWNEAHLFLVRLGFHRGVPDNLKGGLD